AEDGIRDKLVTGVQTCALPIYGEVKATWLSDSGRNMLPRPGGVACKQNCRGVMSGRTGASRERAATRSSPRRFAANMDCTASLRSEERRVGKECRSREATDHEK